MATFCNIDLSDGAALAPMAGFTDDIFRMLCAEHGAIFTVSEMVSVRAVTLGDKKSHTLCENRSSLRPYGIQLFGSRAEDFAVAAQRLLCHKPDFYDINCGCPAPKITGPGGGSALLRSPELVGDIVRAVLCAGLPVSVKLRTGIEGENLAVAAALAAQQAGASLVTVHGRYQKQGYRPPVDYTIAAEVKKALSVPMLYNGDVCDAQSAISAKKLTGADGVMVGRAALGNPFVFDTIKNGTPASDVTTHADMMLRHATLIDAHSGTNGIRAFRGHISHYIKGYRGASALRKKAVSVCTLDDVKVIVRELQVAGH